MDISSILKKVGGSLLKNAMPPLSGMAFDLINDALPAGKKLSEASTGADAEAAVASLPAEQRSSLLEKKLDVEIEEIRGFSERFNAAMEADKTGNTTRPQIALMMGKIVSFAVIVSVTALFIAIFTKDSATIDKMSALWPLMLAILATPTALLRAYFAMRSREKETRYQAVSNQPVASSNLIGNIVSMFKK